MANAPDPGWQRQQPARTDPDVFDDEGQVPESPAAARALRMLNSKQRSTAPKITNINRPKPECATDAPLPRALTESNAQQDADDTPLHPHEHSLNCALARMQLRIRQNHYTSPSGAQSWDDDMAHFRHVATSAYGKRALGWCEIAQHTIEEERASRAGDSRQKDVEIRDLRRDVDRLMRDYDGLRRCADGEIGSLRREIAELKGLDPALTR